MVPVKKIDISWSDLAFGFWKTIFPFSKNSRIDFSSNESHRIVPCFCVRTGFDRLFAVLNLPKGSEVIMSAVTIASMEKIVRHHGLIPVPVDLDPSNFHPLCKDIEAKITPRTKMVILTHLFGNYTDSKEICELAKRNNLIILEDCAQFPGIWHHKSQHSDVVMYSFGPAKAATSLGGALFCIKDLELENKLRKSLSELPVQSRFDFFSRLVRYSLIKILGTIPIYTFIYYVCKLVGFPLQEKLGRSSVFGKKDFLKEIKKQPALPLIHLLARRVFTSPNEKRGQLGAILANGLPKNLQVGAESTIRAHLVFPIVVENREEWMKHLQKNHFDTACHDNLIVIGTDEEKISLKNANYVLSNLVYIPFYPELGVKYINRLSEILNKRANSECVGSNRQAGIDTA